MSEVSKDILMKLGMGFALKVLKRILSDLKINGERFPKIISSHK
jgi:hypothetical protein